MYNSIAAKAQGGKVPRRSVDDRFNNNVPSDRTPLGPRGPYIYSCGVPSAHNVADLILEHLH